MQRQLIVSSDPQQAATILCESATSSGPDFVPLLEGLFCDMDGKVLWPLFHEYYNFLFRHDIQHSPPVHRIIWKQATSNLREQAL